MSNAFQMWVNAFVGRAPRLPWSLGLLLACSTLATTRAEGAKLLWQSVPHSTDIVATGEPFTEAVTFELGTFTPPFKPSVVNLGQWAEHWNVIDRTSYNPETGFFASTVQFVNNEPPYVEGRQVYMWGTTGGIDPEWLLVTKGDWEFPSANLGFPLTWNIAEASRVIVGAIDRDGDPFLMRSARVNGSLLTPSLSPEQWLGVFFNEEQLGAGRIGDLSADPDGDGRDNLMEMALGTHPLQPEVLAALPLAVDLVTVSGFRYLRLTVAKGNVQQLRYHVEVSDLESPWQRGAGHTVVLTDNVATLSVRDKVAFETGRPRFIRLTVEQ